MVLGALIDAGLDPDALRAELGRLSLTGYRLVVERGASAGLSGTHVRVDLEAGPQPERTLGDIGRIIESSGLTPRVKKAALSVFERLAVVEARIHGTSV